MLNKKKMTKQAWHLEEGNRAKFDIYERASKRPFDRLTALNGVEGLKKNRNSKQMKLNCGAQRHHYSMFNVGRSMFILSVFVAYK
jgi:hypothetical protein